MARTRQLRTLRLRDHDHGRPMPFWYSLCRNLARSGKALRRSRRNTYADDRCDAVSRKGSHAAIGCTRSADGCRQWVVGGAVGRNASGRTAGDRLERLEPIVPSGWITFQVRAEVPKDAKTNNFGLVLVGDGKAWLDSIVLTTGEVSFRPQKHYGHVRSADEPRTFDSQCDIAPNARRTSAAHIWRSGEWLSTAEARLDTVRRP